ncbi:MAG: class I SAM-dependent methyltransferase [Phormidesmis sp.]
MYKTIKNNIVHSRCPLCKAKNIYALGKSPYPENLYYSTERIEVEHSPELWKCRRCSSGFIQNIIPENTSISLYSEGSSADRWINHLKFSEAKSEATTVLFSKILIENKTVLDIGCNSGEFLDYAKDKGCKTFGLEYSQTSLKVLNTKGHIAHDKWESFGAEQKFDVITAFDLIEHLYDVPEFMKQCAERLNPGGYFIFLSGDISSFSAVLAQSLWWYTRFPEHIVFPSKKYIKKFTSFDIELWIPTYHSKAAEAYSVSCKKNKISFFKNLLSSLVKKEYSGMPTLSPDHALVVLRHA